MADEVAAAVAGVFSDLFPGGEDAAVAEPEGSEQSAPEAAEEAAPAFDIPSFEADTDGIEDLLAQDDAEYTLEDDDDPEPVLEQIGEYDDPEVAKLKAKLAKAEKQIKFQSELRAKDNQKQWRAEGARRFPLADVEDIDATSRRGFLRKAQEQHERYERKLKPITEALDQLKTAAVAEVRQQARGEAEQAWGRPTSGPNVPQVQQAEDTAKLDRRNFRTVHEITLARIKNGFQI